MRLTVATPLGIVFETDDVSHLRAEDETGAFGLLPGHADFLTALEVSVITWRDKHGAEHHVAVHGGMLEVRGGDAIVVATPEAVYGDDLVYLETDVLVAFRRRLEEERTARTDSQRLHLAALRQICHFLKPESASAVPGGTLKFVRLDR
jgi:F-type H+-transporting ATPase subunit epsilon